MIAHDEGEALMVFYALPGELVEVVPRGRRGGLTYANAVQVLESSAERVPPRCPHFGECGGCQWQHAGYGRQLELKREVVDEAWRRAGVRLPPDAPVLGMVDPWRYRIRGEFEALTDRPPVGRTSRLTPAIGEAVRQELEKGDRTWTAPQLAEWIEQQFHVRVSAAHRRRFRRRWKLSYQRTGRSVRHQQKPEEVTVKKEELEGLEKRGSRA